MWIDFLKQKRFPAKDKGKYNTPTNNIVPNAAANDDVQINHTIIKHNTEIM